MKNNKKIGRYTRRLPVTRSREKRENVRFKSLLNISQIETPIQKFYRLQQAIKRTVPAEQKLFQVSATIEQLKNYVNLTNIDPDIRVDCFIQSLFASAIIGAPSAQRASLFANKHNLGVKIPNALDYISKAFGIKRDNLSGYTFYNTDIYDIRYGNPTETYFSPTPTDFNGVEYINNYLDVNLVSNYITFLNIAFENDYGGEEGHAIVCMKTNEQLIFFDPQNNEEGLYEKLEDYLHGIRVLRYIFFQFVVPLREPLILKNDSCYLKIQSI